MSRTLNSSCFYFALSDDSFRRARASELSPTPQRTSISSIRVIDAVILIFSIFILVFSGCYFALNIALLSSCQSVHEDPFFFVFLATGNPFEKIPWKCFSFSSLLCSENGNMSKLFRHVIEDYRNDVHFTRRLMEKYSPVVDQSIEAMFESRNQQIQDQVKVWTEQAQISNHINGLNFFAKQINRSDILEPLNHVIQDFTQIRTFLDQINHTNVSRSRHFFEQAKNEVSEPSNFLFSSSSCFFLTFSSGVISELFSNQRSILVHYH